MEGFPIKVLTREIVSNTEIIKNYKACREKAEKLGKVFVWKGSQPDAVLYSIAEYERLSPVLEYIENLDENELKEFINSLPERK